MQGANGVVCMCDTTLHWLKPELFRYMLDARVTPAHKKTQCSVGRKSLFPHCSAVPGHPGLLLGGSLQPGGDCGLETFCCWVFLGGGLVELHWWSGVSRDLKAVSKLMSCLWQQHFSNSCKCCAACSSPVGQLGPASCSAMMLLMWFSS